MAGADRPEPVSVWLSGEPDDPFVLALRGRLSPDILLHVGEAPPAGASPRVLVRGVPTEEQLAACPALEVLLIPYAGLPAATAERLRARPTVAVHNLHHNAAPTAELAVGLLLACAREIVPHDAELRRGDWRRRYGEATGATMAGGHAVVVGHGAIGRRVARALSALGMRVTAVRRSIRAPTIVDGIDVVPADALGAHLPTADAVILCAPLTPETRGLMDADMLALLPSTAYLVNVGRGELCDEAALYEALRTRRLAGAGLDVWYRYPREVASRTSTLPSALPFHELEHVVLSPHRAGKTRQNEAARAADVAAFLGKFAAGEPLPDRVDLDRGY